MDENVEIPADLKPDGAGARLWLWLHEQCANVGDSAPLCEELCRMTDRLAQVRVAIAAQGLQLSGPRGRPIRNGLLDLEIKLSKQVTVIWRGLGLSDKPQQGDLWRG